MSSLAELLATDFVQLALASGIALALVSGPLGSFIVWRKMSYFGDTLAHSALLGVSFALLTDMNIQLGIVVGCLVVALLLGQLSQRKELSSDTLLGILAHSSLALGVLLLALTDARQVNIESYLFGALLTVSINDMLWVVAICALVAGLVYWLWNDLLSITVDEELARVEGLNTARLNTVLVVAIAMVIAVSMKIVGVLLITSLLIIPPAAARNLSSTPETMAAIASSLGVLAVVLGLLLSFLIDAPPGPTIVVIATLVFGAVQFFKR